VATDYAEALLRSMGAHVGRDPGPADMHPAITWARSGLMALTGRVDGPPQMCPVPLTSCADGVAKALRAVAPALRGNLPSGALLLGERAAIAGLRRNGSISPSGSCHLLRAANGWLAVNLARADDWAAVPAWLQTEAATSWDALGATVARCDAAMLVDRARLLGLAVTAAEAPCRAPVSWYSVAARGCPVSPGERRGLPLVVDLSSLWAGPLCSHMLQSTGARVIKVESRTRPDGARAGAEDFYDVLNSGKQSVALDFGRDGVGRLLDLLARADIVIEASRPRALRQLGVIAEDWIVKRPGLTWVSITGYGREEPRGNWTSFGDDAGVAAGLSALLQRLTGEWLICGDAIADPLTGLHAALAALGGHRCGGGHLVSLALCDVVSHCVQFLLPGEDAELRERWLQWSDAARAAGVDSTPPSARRPVGKAPSLGADTDAVLAERGDQC